MQTGCQVDCHVSHRDWLLWASGCFGVYIKRTGCEHENSSRFPPIYPIFCLSYTAFFPVPFALGLSFLSPPLRGRHPRCWGTFELGRRSGTPAGMPRRCMTELRGNGGMEVEKKGGHTSKRHIAACCVARDDS